jgi:hypothetical protein
MKKVILLLTVFVCAFSGYSQTARQNKNQFGNGVARTTAANTTTLPIKRVILYSNGVAYIERRGMVSGNAEIDLSFKQSQVDDVLKSMIVLDLGRGRIGAVSYNSSQPASARTAEIPFAVDAETNDGAGIAKVLSQLQGERVSITSAKGTAAGAILTVETRKIEADKDRPARLSHFLVIASETGEISNHDLADVKGVRLMDEGSRSDLNEFANATASTRRRDAKTISVTSQGTGQREMVVSYTVSAPIWKTTYRVVLDTEGQPFFQGWAIVDNVSEESWDNVQLSLVSGSPVSFIQNLQKPLYRYRPIIPIPEDLNLRPQIYDPENGTGEGLGSGVGSGAGDGVGGGRGYGTGLPPAMPKPLFADANSNFMVSTGFAGSSVSDALMNEQGGVETAAVGSEIGDLFEYRIEQPVTVERNRSALIPIIQTKMEGERVSIFRANAAENENNDSDDDDDDDEQEAVTRANPRPMSGLLLKNTSAMTFEGGSMTVLDRDAYAGEALMERLKPKEQRLISFALDMGTLIRVEEKEDREPARMVKVVNGVFQVHYFKTDKKVYRLSNQTDRPKSVYVEHPVRKNWVLSPDFAKPDYTTARFYRFRVPLAPFENKEITVAENFGMMDTYNLSSLSPKDLEVFVISRSIDDATRTRLAKLIDLRMQINQIVARLEGLATETSSISTDQERFRENIEALAKTSEAKQLIARYIAKANEQESRLEQIETERKAAQTDKERLERELATEIKNFEVR